MAARIDYNVIIKDLENYSGTKYVLNQKKAKKLVNGELPKSLFSETYVKRGRNAFARYLNNEGYKYEVIPAQIVVYKEESI